MTLQYEAQQQSKATHYPEALRLYKLAYEVEPDPVLLFNIARMLHKQGQGKEAVGYYRKFLESGISDEEQRLKAKDYIAQLEKIVQQQQLAPPVQSTSVQPVPVYKKGWFWGVMAGSVAAAGLAVGLGVGLSNRTPSLPSGVNTYDPTF